MTFSLSGSRKSLLKQWWATSDDLDRHIKSRFGALYWAAVRCELYGWRESAKGRLAEIIVLDQFSRNIYRNHPNAFAYDCLALALAQTAVAVNADHELDITNGPSCYAIHAQRVADDPRSCDWAVQPTRYGSKPTVRVSAQESSTVSAVIHTAT